MLSSMPQRRLVLNHTRGMYHFSIQGRTVCQGPMHLVYVRLALSSDGDAWDWTGSEWEGHGWIQNWEGPTVHLDTPTLEAPPLSSTPRLGAKEFRFLAQLLIYWQPMEVASSSWSFVATS